MWALTRLKDFRIASCIRKIGMQKLLTLGMNHPVHIYSSLQANLDFEFKERPGGVECWFLDMFEVVYVSS